MFDFTSMGKVLESLEIQEPKLIINLFGSFSMNADCYGRSVHHSEPPATKDVDYAEMSMDALIETERKMGKVVELNDHTVVDLILLFA